MHGIPVFLIAPKGLDLTVYDGIPELKTVFFDPRFFTDVLAYNKLMLSIGFYRRFRAFKYMLIAQTDALILRDAGYLQTLIAQHDYDYWGAPWLHAFNRGKIDYSCYHKRLAEFQWTEKLMPPLLRCEVGNGGLSLRNTSASIRLLFRFFIYKTLWGGPEDCFFSYFGQINGRAYKIADRETASLFCLEETLHKRLHSQDLPFGIHDWKHYLPELMKYWKDIQADRNFFHTVFTYTVGQTLYFDAPRFNASPYIFSGIARCEQDFSWFVEQAAVFAFRIESARAAGSTLQLMFTIDQTYRTQTVHIYANEQFIGTKTLSGAGTLLIELPLSVCPDVRLHLEFPDARTPESYTVGTDIRNLSIAVTKMESRIIEKKGTDIMIIPEQHKNAVAFEGKDNYGDRYKQFDTELAQKDPLIAQLTEREQNLNEQIRLRDKQIRERDKQIHDCNVRIRDLEEQIEAFLHSKSWRITKPFRFTKKCIRAIYRLLVPGKLRKAVWIFRHKGMSGMKEYAEEEKFDPTLPEPITYRPVLLADEPYTVHELPVSENPLVSIIIPVYNQFGYTYKCIRSILALPDKVAYEIIIGDDLSTDETKDITSWFPGVRINRNETDHGFIMNCNRAARLARGKYILFLNNDTQVQDGWLESLVRLMECDETTGMAGSKLVYPDGRLQEAGGIIWRDASGRNYGRNKNPELPEYNYVKEVDYISGASIIIRRTLWDEIGGFDERYKPAYFEDSDFAFEVRKHGYRVMYQPQSTVVHFEGISNGTDLNSGLKKYQVENRDKFIAKWADELKKQYAGDKDAFLARERNFGKKVILIIDHYVPTFDKDAGSKTTFQYIKMFLAKGFCVKFVGDNYARTEMEPYMSILLQMGVEVLYGVWYSNNIFTYIKQNEKYIDFVYLNRPHITAKYIDFIRNETNIKILYYGHDLHFFRIQREYELTGNTKLLPDIENNRNAEFTIMRKADVVYYPSCLEEKVIREIDSSIHVKAIHAYIFDTDSLTVQYKSRERSGILFVGGFSHTPNVDAVKWFAGEIFPKIRANNPGIDFYIAGSNAPDEIKELDGNGIIFKGFVTEAELARLYASCRIVVVPLRYGAGVKGKVVEALYNGVPIVTTDIGAEGIEGIEDIAAIHNEAEAFAEAVLRLYDDGDRLGEMSRKSIEFIKENFSMEAAWNIIREDFV